MSDQQSVAMWVLIAIFAVLFLAIIGVMIKRPKALDLDSQKPISERDSKPAAILSTVKEEFLVEKPAEAKPPPIPEKETNLKSALAETEKILWGRFKILFSSGEANKNFDEIEEILYTSDLGPMTVERVMDVVKSDLSRSEKSNIESVKTALKKEFADIFQAANIQEPTLEKPFSFLHLDSKPSVWLIVGVNGAGKTTSIGKLAARLAADGKKVLVAAGDTFRAAAESQLKVWTERAQVEIFSPGGVSDPSAVAFDAVAKAKAQGYDVVLIDTAGRLHTQANLMEELKKLQRVLKKVISDSPHETLLVLDGNSGQNALIQARQFNQALQLTGIVLTKMDGSAKGGVAVGIAHELKVPIRFIGIGEKVGDLRPFSAKEFVDSIL